MEYTPMVCNKISKLCKNKVGKVFTKEDYQILLEYLKFINKDWYERMDEIRNILESEEISKLIEERQKYDDGTRYTTEDIKRLRSELNE